MLLRDWASVEIKNETVWLQTSSTSADRQASVIWDSWMLALVNYACVARASIGLMFWCRQTSGSGGQQSKGLDGCIEKLHNVIWEKTGTEKGFTKKTPLVPSNNNNSNCK